MCHALIKCLSSETIIISEVGIPSIPGIDNPGKHSLQSFYSSIIGLGYQGEDRMLATELHQLESGQVIF